MRVSDLTEGVQGLEGIMAGKPYATTEGVQELEGTMAGKPYAPNSFWDYMVESFAGTHDAIDGGITGLYDSENVRLVSKHEFKEFKKTLLALRPRAIEAPFNYPGTWYGLALSYEKQPTDGFGIREHPKYGTVIDITNLILGHPCLSFIIDQ